MNPLRLSAPLQKGMESMSYNELCGIPLPTDRVSPIRPRLIADCVFDYLNSAPEVGRCVDTFYGADRKGEKFVGFFKINHSSDHDFNWVIAATNDNASGGGVTRGSFELHCGIALPFVGNAVLFSASDRVTTKLVFKDREQIQSLVNEKLEKLREFFVLQHERCDHFKKRKLSPQEASHIICNIIANEVVAGRLSAELIENWLYPKFDYLKPRTLWSLFCLCAWFLNRLNASVLIDRTVELHHFFDDVGKFNKKPTKWMQTTFA